MEVGMAEEAELVQLLAEDDNLNFTDEPTYEKLGDKQHTLRIIDDLTFVSMSNPSTPENFPTMQTEENSVSTFHPNRATNNTSNHCTTEDTPLSSQQSGSTSWVREQVTAEDPEMISKMSDSASHITSLESDINDLNIHFRAAVDELQQQAKQQAVRKTQQDDTLEEILKVLKIMAPNPQILEISHLKWLTTHRRLTPAVPLGLLAIVNNPGSSSSGRSRDTKDSRDLLGGDVFLGNFGDVIKVKQEHTLRIRLQNVGALSSPKRNAKREKF